MGDANSCIDNAGRVGKLLVDRTRVRRLIALADGQIGVGYIATENGGDCAVIFDASAHARWIAFVMPLRADSCTDDVLAKLPQLNSRCA